MVITEKPSTVCTILGSCVSVTFYNSRTETGGIIHAMYPGYLPDRKMDHLLFADTAVRKMADEFFKRGISSDEIEVKIFGGEAVIE
jgi:chemotaxis protein CheD